MSRTVTDAMTPQLSADAPASPVHAVPGGDSDALDRLLPIVFGDRAVRDHLLGAGDREEFCRRLGRTAADHGIELSPARIGELFDGARRRWIERWL
jgi:hypothetical protein